MQTCSALLRFAVAVCLFLALAAGIPLPTRAQSIVTMPTLGNNGCGGTQTSNVSNFGTPNATVTAGDTLVVLVTMAGDSHVTGIVSTDGSGDTWTVIPSAHGYDSNAGSINIAYSQNISAATNGAFGTITTTSANTIVGVCAFEITGVPTTAQPIDCAASADITSSQTTYVTPPCTTGAPNELIVAVGEGVGDGDTTTAEGGITFTPIDGPPDGNGIYGDPGGIYSATATGTYEAGLVEDSASTGTVAIVSFIGAGQLAAPTSLQVTPANANLMVGGRQAFTAVDQNGTPRPDATWSINDTSVANFVEGSANTLTGIAAGQATLTAAIGSLSAQAQVTVLSGSLAPGTSLWSAPTVPGFSGEFQSTIIQAVPSDGGPDVYSVDADSSGDVLVRAFHSDGEQKWQHLISGAFTALQTFYTAMGDGAGGVLISSATSQQEGGGGSCITTSAVLTSYIFDLNGMNGNQNWEYATASGSGIGRVAVGPDGTVYAVETGNSVCADSYSNNTQGFLDRINGQTGALVSRTALPGSTSQSTCDAPNPPAPWFPNPYDLTVAGSYGPLMVGADGTVYFEAITSQYTEDITPEPSEGSDCFFADGSSTYSWAEQIQLLTLSPEGSLSSQPLDSTGSAGSFSDASLPGHSVGDVIPDGQGGELASWTFDPEDGGDAPIPLKVADIGSGGAQATLNALDMETSMDDNLVLGDNGMAFATDGNAVVALDASSLAPIWTYTSQGGDELVAATSGGGVLLNDFSLGGIQLDSNGTAGSPLASLQHATAIQYAPPLFDPATGSMFGEWATDAGGVLSASASTYLPVAISDWNTPGGNAENQRSSPKFDLELVWCTQGSCSGLFDAEGEPVQNVAFQYFQDNPQEDQISTITLTASQTAVIQQSALQAFQKAFAAYPKIHAGTGRRGTNVLYVVGEFPNLQGGELPCGGTRLKGTRWSSLFYQTAMEQAQWALNLQTTNPPQNLLQAIGSGIGNIAAHEVGHELGLPNMDDGSYLDQYNDGSCDGERSPWFFTGQSGGTPIHWAPASDQALKNISE